MGRKKTAPTKTVRIDLDVYENASLAAAFEKKDLGEYISETLRPIVEKAVTEHARNFKPARPPKGTGDKK